jgi:hypothetical protein
MFEITLSWGEPMFWLTSREKALSLAVPGSKGPLGLLKAVTAIKYVVWAIADTAT